MVNFIGMLNSIDLSNHLVAGNYLGRALLGFNHSSLHLDRSLYDIHIYTHIYYIQQGIYHTISYTTYTPLNSLRQAVFRRFVGSFSPDIPFTVRVNILMVPLFVWCGYLRQGDQADAQTVLILLLNEAIELDRMKTCIGRSPFSNSVIYKKPYIYIKR